MITKFDIIDILEKNKCMSFYEDIFVESIILSNELFSGVKVLELGTGGAGWPLTLHDLGVDNKKWLLMDNFSWVKNGNPLGWDSLEHLEVSISRLGSFNIIDADVNVDSISQNSHFKQVKVIRIDCHIEEETLEYLIENVLTDDGVVFIDDTTVGYGFTRIHIMFTLLLKHKFKLMWNGSKEVALCRTDGVIHNITNDIYTNLKDSDFVFFNKNFDKMPLISEQKMYYISTTPFKLGIYDDNN